MRTVDVDVGPAVGLLVGVPLLPLPLADPEPDPMRRRPKFFFVGLALGLTEGLAVGLWVAPDPEPELYPDADL